MASVALELEREIEADRTPPSPLAPPALAFPLPELAGRAPAGELSGRLASLPTPQRARALAGMQRGYGNAAVTRIVATRPARPLARAGQRCACGGTIGPDGQCDKCRAMRAAGLEPEPGSQGDEAIARAMAAGSPEPSRAGADPAERVLARDDRDDEAAAPAEPECTTRCGGISAACPPPFCCPYPLGTATIIREQIRTPFLAAIATQVTASVVPVWLMWFNGGAGMQNFNGRFGADFASDPTTARVSSLLAADVAASLDPVQLAQLAGAVPGATVSLLSALPTGYTTAKTQALERTGDPLLMDFNTIGTAPGNLAGGVGKTQSTCRVGATPGALDDARILTDVQATLVRNPDGSITVTPTLHFRVIDTVDLCPGNCGSGLGLINEQLATYPMSRLEASGVAGDVPFTVEFPVAQGAFTIPPPAPPAPQHVVVSSSTLFDFGSDRLSSGGEAAILAALGDRPNHADLTQPFNVEGHTDSKGSDQVNQALSERRAATVAEVLRRNYPSLTGHLVAVGFGETRPVAPNDSGGVDNPAGRALNRRVEMRFFAPPPP